MAGTQAPGFSSYDRYVRAEWQLFTANPQRELTAREAVAGVRIARVLDVGCGAGQELRSFLGRPDRLGIGVDVSPEAGMAGRQLFSSEQPGSRVVFVRAAAERLPFVSASMDLVVCRLVLPYTDNARAVAEMSRVLRRGGILLLKFHHARFYVRELRTGIARRQIKSAVHACRVLLSGLLYHATRSQPRGRVLGSEVFQTISLIRRELNENGLEVLRELSDSNLATPSLVARRVP